VLTTSHVAVIFPAVSHYCVPTVQQELCSQMCYVWTTATQHPLIYPWGKPMHPSHAVANALCRIFEEA